MKHFDKWTLMLVLSGTLVFAGCGDDGGGTVDSSVPDASFDADVPDATPDATPDAMADAMVDAGPGDFTFRTDMPATYTRVDRNGAPAVSTALVSAAMKNAFNNGDPTDDVSGAAPGRWAGEFIASLDGLHAAVGATSGITINAQLTGAGLTPCTDGTDCATQDVAVGVPVYSFVIPDVLTINTGADAGFPNGRRLVDPALDIVLALVLLDLDTHGVTTFADIPLNPAANDVAFDAAFPYVAAPHAP